MSSNDNKSIEKPKMERSRCLRLWWNSCWVRRKGKARCQIRHQRLQGREEEDHHHYHDTERQELQAEEGEETPIHEGEGSGRRPDKNRKGRRAERPAPQPEEDDYDLENDEQFNLFSRVMANALGQQTRVPAEPPAMFRNEKHQDIRMWLMTCTDYFGRNSWQ